MVSAAPAQTANSRPGGFRPPPYPYARLGALRATAAALPGGAVDLSVGSPCDEPSPAVLAALAAGDDGGATRGYPASAGSPTARRAAADWMGRRFGVTVDPGLVALAIGTKELVAGLPLWLHLRIRPETRSCTPSWPTRPMKWGRYWRDYGRCRCRSTRGSAFGLQKTRSARRMRPERSSFG